MAERRMFAKSIIDSDEFLDMPLSAQALYFQLGMRADDDGFVNNSKRIQKMLGASVEDIAILINKKFIINFDSGVIVIKHWKINNYIRNDRYKSTNYVEEKSKLKIKNNGAYTLGIPEDKNVVYQKDEIFSLFEQVLMPLSPNMYEKINRWIEEMSGEVVKCAVEITINNKKTFNYLEGIIRNWKAKGIKTLEDIQKEKKKTTKSEVPVPDWLGKDIPAEKVSEEELEELNRILEV